MLTTENTVIGFIGTGVMGKSMAMHLLHGGYRVVAYNRTKEKAIELLNSTNLTINKISEKVGYDTQHYFSTSFKKVMGIPPNQYRNGNAFSNKRNDV